MKSERKGLAVLKTDRRYHDRSKTKMLWELVKLAPPDLGDYSPELNESTLGNLVILTLVRKNISNQ